MSLQPGLRRPSRHDGVTTDPTITRCRASSPLTAMQGTSDGAGHRPAIDANALRLMCEHLPRLLWAPSDAFTRGSSSLYCAVWCWPCNPATAQATSSSVQGGSRAGPKHAAHPCDGGHKFLRRSHCIVRRLSHTGSLGRAVRLGTGYLPHIAIASVGLGATRGPQPRALARRRSSGRACWTRPTPLMNAADRIGDRCG